MAKIGLPKGPGKRLKVSEKSGNFEMDIEWQPCNHDKSSKVTCAQQSLGPTLISTQPDQLSLF